MNQFFYESRGKEKVRDLLQEGQQSQAFERSGAHKLGLLNGPPKLILIVLGVLGMLEFLIP